MTTCVTAMWEDGGSRQRALFWTLPRDVVGPWWGPGGAGMASLLVALVRGGAGMVAGGAGGALGAARAARQAVRAGHSNSSCLPCAQFTVVPCACCDEDRVLSFMARTFFRDEPVLVAAGLTGKRGGCDATPPVMLAHARSSLREGLSLMAVDAADTLRILGVAVNSVVSAENACELRRQAAESCCPATRRALELWAHLLERPEVWAALEPAEGHCMLELQALATEPSARGQGVGLQLALASREMASNIGAPAFKMDCTSLYSAKVAEKLGMKKVVAIRYADYLGPDKKPVFVPPCPHEEMSVFVQKLSKECQQKFGGET